MTEEIRLLKASLGGDTTAFEKIVYKYQSLVCAITFCGTGRLDISEDLAQETFLRAWHELFQLKELEKFRPWLCSIARNLLRNHYRSTAVDRTSPCDTDTMAQMVSTKIPNPSEQLISREEEMILSQALMQIPEEYREPLVLYYRQQQSTKEVAESLDLNEATVRTRLSRGRQMLKDQVATMVERTLEKTGPSKKFTKTVMVAIGGGLAAGTAATATAASVNSSTAAGGASAILTGVGIKVAAIAAAVIIATGAIVYSYWNPSNHTPASNQLVNTELATEKPTSTLAMNTQSAIKPVKLQLATSPNPQNSSGKEPTSPSQNTAAAESVPQTKSGTGVSGVILDKSTSKPIKDAEIFYGRDNPHSVFSDTNGHFELLGMKPMPRQRFYVIAKSYTSRTIVLEIIKDKMYLDFKIELVPGSRVAGVVSDPNGKAIEGVTVETASFTNHPVLTNKDGEFEIDGLDPAFGQYQLQAVCPRYPAVSKDFSPSATGQTAFMDIVLKPGITVHGRITNAQSQPLSDVSVGNTTSRSMWNCIQTKTDKDGSYQLKNIPEGDFVIWAVSKQYAPYVEQIVLDSLQPAKLMNIRLADPCPIHGKIIDTLGNPVPDINICLREYKGVTNLSSWNDRKKSDSAGKFIIPNGPCEGKMILEAFGESIPNTMPQFEAGQEKEYIITVDRAGRIYGKVLDDQTGKSVNKFNVKLRRTSKGTGGGGYSTTWGDQGHMFESPDGVFDTGIETIAIGKQYAVTVSADSFDPLTLDPVTVQPISDDPNRTEFRLKAATVITGRVVDCNSMAVEGATIRWLTDKNRLDGFEHWDPRDMAMTNSKGEFTLSGVGFEKGIVYITASTFAPYICLPTSLPRNSQGSVEIVLAPGASIFGKVLDSNGQGQMEASVSAHIFMEQLQQIFNSPYPNLKSVTAEADGYYEIADLPAGNFSVSVNTSAAQGNQNYAHKKITLKAGQSLEMNFGNEPGFTVTGVIRKGQQLLEGATVEIDLPDQSTKYEYTNHNGRFIIKGVPAGSYPLSATYYTGDNLTSSQGRPDLELRKDIQVTIKDNTTLDINFSNSSIKGKLPDSYLHYEKLGLRASRCTDEKSDSDRSMKNENAITTVIDSNGYYACHGLNSGRYYLLLEASGQTIAVSDVIELGESQQVENVPFHSGTGKLQIHCIDSETGQDVPGAQFAIYNEFGASFHSQKLCVENHWFMRTNNRGSAEYTDLPPGNYRIKAQTDGYLVCQSDFFVVDNNTTTPVTLSINAGSVVRFKLSEHVKPQITANIAYLLCQITNLDTQESVSVKDISNYDIEKEHLVFLYAKNSPTPVDSLLNLPPGRYEIKYHLYQSEYGFSRNETTLPLLSGKYQIELAKRDTKLLTIAQSQ